MSNLLDDYTIAGIDDNLIAADSILNNENISDANAMTDIATSVAESETRLLTATHNIVFSTTDADTVSWTAGVIYLKDGSYYTIGLGNTGNMAAETFIYFDLDVSKVALQHTTTKSDTEGPHKMLLAIAQNSTTEALFTVFNSKEQNIPGGSIEQGSITMTEIGEKAIMGWQSTCLFSASDYRVVAWTAGAITLTDGTVYTIGSGNTGNMVALTYIYFDIATPTILKTSTTAATAVGTGKFLLAVAQNNTDTTSKATFQAFGGSGGTMLAVDNIAANSASVNEFVANTANIKDAVVTNAKIVDLIVSKLLAGTITSKAFTLAVAGAGDCYFNAGKTDFTNTESGFIIGIDDSDSDLPKFYIGNLTSYFNWTGTAMVVLGNITNIENYTEGETLAVNDVVCIKNNYSDSLVSITTDAHTASSNADTNYGTDTELWSGSADGGAHGAGSHNIYVKIPSTPGISLYRIQKVVLRMYLIAKVGASPTLTLNRITADWAEDTITWNNDPAITDDLHTAYFTTHNKVISESGANWVEFDITNLYKYWVNSDITNYGLCFVSNAGAGAYLRFSSSEGSNPPVVRITYLGNSDGEAYKADSDDYNLCRNILGIVKSRDGVGTCQVQKTNYINIGTYTAGYNIYLGNVGAVHSGSIAYYRNVKIGRITATTGQLELAIQNQDILIEKLIFPPDTVTGVGTLPLTVNFTTTKLHPLFDCRKARIFLEADSGDGTIGFAEYFKGFIEVKKDNLIDNTIYLQAGYYVAIDWSDASTISFTRGNGTEACKIWSVEYYN